MKCCLNGENSIIIYFADKPTPKLIQTIASTQQVVAKLLGSAYVDSIISYISLVIFYDINQLSAKQALTKIKQIIKTPLNNGLKFNSKTHQIPVLYDESVGLDLAHILATKNISKDELIKYHTKQTYLVYSIGFMPNFAYLASLDSRLCSPRHKTPRAQIPPGSVGIADCQTGIYPSATPAGWQIIGRTPLDLSNNSNIEFKVGDKVQFISIDNASF